MVRYHRRHDTYNVVRTLKTKTMEEKKVEAFNDKSIRARINVQIGNPIIKTEAQLGDYKALCEYVKEFNVSFLEMQPERVIIQNGRHRKNAKYVRGAGMVWLKTQLKELNDKAVYEEAAGLRNVIVFKDGRSKQLVNAIEYALTLNPLVNKQEDNIVITSDTLTYAFNLNNLTIKDRKTVEDMFKLKRLEALLEKTKK